MLKGFREFIMRGNVMDLAVAVVIGAAFTTVVNAIVDSLITPLVGAVFNAESLSKTLIVQLPGGAQLGFGAILAAIINFLIVALVVYLIFVMPMNKLHQRQEARKKALEPETAPEVTEVELLAEIRDLLSTRGTATGGTSDGRGHDGPAHGA